MNPNNVQKACNIFFRVGGGDDSGNRVRQSDDTPFNGTPSSVARGALIQQPMLTSVFPLSIE